MFDLGSIEVEFKCPKCHKVNKLRLIQVKNKETIICIGCKNKIKLEDKNGSVEDGIKEINDSINNLFK